MANSALSEAGLYPEGGIGDRIAGLVADLRLTIGGLREDLSKQQQERRMIGQNVYPIQIPAGFGTVTGGGALSIRSSEQFGPRRGKVWDVRRVSVSGLASTSESVSLYRETGSGAHRTQIITQITAQSTAALTGIYSPGLGACLLTAGYSLMLSGSSLTAGENITVTWDAIEISETWLGEYLL